MNRRLAVIVIVSASLALLLGLLALWRSQQLERRLTDADCIAQFQTCEDQCQRDLDRVRASVGINTRLRIDNHRTRVAECNRILLPELKQTCIDEADATLSNELDELGRLLQNAINAYRYCRLGCAEDATACQGPSLPGKVTRPFNYDDFDGDGKSDIVPVDDICKYIAGGVCGDCFRSFCPGVDYGFEGKQDFLIEVVNLNDIDGSVRTVDKFESKNNRAIVRLNAVADLYLGERQALRITPKDGTPARDLDLKLIGQ